MRLAVLALFVVGCSGCNPSTAPSPVTSAQPTINAADCDDACATAQSKCQSHTPSTVEHCLGKCRASTQVTTDVSCLAVMFTCDEECP